MIGKILIHRVGVAVVIVVVPTEEHLPTRAAMEKQNRWMALRLIKVCGKE